MRAETSKIKEYTVKDESNARDIALIVLLKVTENKRKSHIALREAFDSTSLSDRDRAFVKRCVDGCLDYLYSLDRTVDRYSKIKSEKLDPVIRGILRLGLYQLKFMEKVPDSAVCNESVKLAKIHGYAHISGFVNGVLRSMARDKAEKADRFFKAESIAEELSVPSFIYETLKREFGEKGAYETAKAYLQERPVQVRFNLSKAPEEKIAKMLTDEGVEIRKNDVGEILNRSEKAGRLFFTSFKERDKSFREFSESFSDYPAVYELCGLKGIEKLKAFREGYIQVQDLSSAAAASLAAPKAGDFIIDVCAAPGGKSILAADMLSLKEKGGAEPGKVLSRDLTFEKVKLISSSIKRCGFKNIEAQRRDALDFDCESEGKADIVIADLPCSGLGIAGKKPDIKWNIKESDFKELSELQKEMLDISGRYVKPGGKLIYSTCTLTREEDEDNAVSFAERNGFELLYMMKLLPAKEHDGFFVAAFIRGDKEISGN